MKKNNAFTLVELLIAASIYAVVMVGILSAFRSGIFGYGHIDRKLGFSQTRAFVLYRVDADIRNIFSFSKTNSMFDGKAGELSFLTEADFYEDGQVRQDVARVAYSFSGNALMRLSRRGKLCFSPDSSEPPDVIWTGLREVSFSYGSTLKPGQALNWSDVWKDPKSLPEAIRLHIVFQDATDQPPLEHIVYLPVSV